MFCKRGLSHIGACLSNVVLSPMEAPARTTGKGQAEAAPELGTQKPTVSAPFSSLLFQLEERWGRGMPCNTSMFAC